jgi:hypothetical protein
VTRGRGKRGVHQKQRPHGGYRKADSGRAWQEISDEWPDLNLTSDVDHTGAKPRPLSQGSHRSRNHLESP